MINGKKLLAVIPARGGSKGIPRKNIKELNGKPLIAWTIEEALKSRYLDRVILSSDDEEIIQVAREWGCEVPFKRPSELALDTTPGIDPVLHAIEAISGYDYVVLLQPTSPLRTVEDIDCSIELCVQRNVDSCVSVTKQDKSPYWMYNLSESGLMIPVMKPAEELDTTRRQNLPDVYSLNGAVYVAKIEKLKVSKSFITENTVAYMMPKDRSIDIDEEIDLILSEAILVKRKTEIKKES